MSMLEISENTVREPNRSAAMPNNFFSSFTNRETHTHTF